MQQDQNKQGLSWSSPSQSNATPAVVSAAPAVASASAAGSTSAPSDKKMVHTQAPVYAGLLVGGIIVGVLLATAWGAVGGNDAPGTAATTTPKAATAGPAAAATTSLKGSTLGAPIVVEDQPAGSDVAISRLAVTKPTWVVVYVSRDGKPGNALGARLFFAGDKVGSVALLRDTVPGQSYFVGLSVDNGDRIFSLSRDAAVSDADGAVLWATFKAR